MSKLPICCRCVECGQRHTVWTTTKAYSTWMKGKEPIQHAMPFLSADDREWLTSSICPHCFDWAFKEFEWAQIEENDL